MKLNEIIPNINNEEIAWRSTRDIIKNYLDKDCVVGYQKTYLGELFFIKGKIKFFCFLYHGEGTITPMHAKELERLQHDNERIAYKSIEEFGKINDKELWSKLGVKIFSEAL